MFPPDPSGPLRPILSRPAHRKPDFALSTVNIVLLLVLFFLIVGAPADPAERQIDLPITRDLPLDGLPRPLVLVEQESGALFLDGRRTARSALTAAIAQGEITRVHLLVARDYPARALLDLSAELSIAGAEVLLVTLRVAREQPVAPTRPVAERG